MDFTAAYVPNSDIVLLGNERPEVNPIQPLNSVQNSAPDIAPLLQPTPVPKPVFNRDEFKRIVRRTCSLYELQTTKYITKHENFHTAIRCICTTWNRLGFESLDFMNEETRKKVGHRICRFIVDSRKYEKNKMSVAAALPVAQNMDDDQGGPGRLIIGHVADAAQLWQNNDTVVVTQAGKALFIGSVCSVAPLNANGELLLNSVAIRKLVDLCNDGAKYQLGQDHIFESICVMKITYPLKRIHTTLESFLQVEQRHAEMGLEAESGSNRLRQSGCTIEHVTGDVVMLDLGSQYATFWPLLAIVAQVKKNKMKIRWLHGVINGHYSLWKENGKVLTQTVAVSSHYYCGFELENGQLPNDARKAAQDLMNEYAEMEDTEAE